MTELEALARECIENHTHKLIARPTKQDIYTREESIYISGYKECERQNKNRIAELEERIERMSELINRYYMACTQIPKELRTMTFDSCLEDTRKMVRDREEKLKCCENCQTVRDANGNCYFHKDGKCDPKTKIKWEVKEC